MSTTLTAVALDDDGYVVANVGDSRTYLLRDGALAPPHPRRQPRAAPRRQRRHRPAEARRHPQRSLVLEALDGDPRAPAAGRRRPSPRRAGDRLLLCSDGLSDALDDDADRGRPRHAAREECAERLVAAALAAGARDNVSVVVADVAPRRDPAAGWR